MEDCFQRGAFAVELARVDRAGRGVERHVEEERAAAGCQRAASGGGAFPFGAAGLVEVEMDVDDAWENMQSAGVDFFGGAGKVRADGGDPAVFDGEIRLTSHRA